MGFEQDAKKFLAVASTLLLMPLILSMDGAAGVSAQPFATSAEKNGFPELDSSTPHLHILPPEPSRSRATLPGGLRHAPAASIGLPVTVSPPKMSPPTSACTVLHSAVPISELVASSRVIIPDSVDTHAPAQTSSHSFHVITSTITISPNITNSETQTTIESPGVGKKAPGVAPVLPPTQSTVRTSVRYTNIPSVVSTSVGDQNMTVPPELPKPRTTFTVYNASSSLFHPGAQSVTDTAVSVSQHSHTLSEYTGTNGPNSAKPTKHPLLNSSTPCNRKDGFTEVAAANSSPHPLGRAISTGAANFVVISGPVSEHVNQTATSEGPSQNGTSVMTSTAAVQATFILTEVPETSIRQSSVATEKIHLSPTLSSLVSVGHRSSLLQRTAVSSRGVQDTSNVPQPVSTVTATSSTASTGGINATDLLHRATNVSGLRIATSVTVSVAHSYEIHPTSSTTMNNITLSDEASLNNGSSGNPSLPATHQELPTNSSTTDRPESATVTGQHMKTRDRPILKTAGPGIGKTGLTRGTTAAVPGLSTRKPIGRGTRAPFGIIASTRRTTKGTPATARPFEKIFDKARTRPHTRPTPPRPTRGMRRITTRKPVRKGFPIRPKPNVSEADFDLNAFIRLIRVTSSPKTKPTTWRTTFFNVTEPTVPNEVERPVVRVAGIIKIVDGWDWSPLLSDRNTHEYRYLAYTIRSLIEGAFRKTSVCGCLYRVEIDGFSPGSVIVDYFLLLYQQGKPVDIAYLTQDFNSRLGRNMSLGEFKLDPAYTQLEVVGIQRPKSFQSTSEPPIPQWAIAVIVIATASLIFIVLFGAVTIYGRSSEQRKYSNRLQEDDMEKMSTPTKDWKDWESKLAASYENFAADGVYDLYGEKERVDEFRKSSTTREVHRMQDTWRTKWGVLTNKQPQHARDTTF